MSGRFLRAGGSTFMGWKAFDVELEKQATAISKEEN